MSTLLEWITDTLFRNWGLKVVSVVLAGVLFVLTRDEVTRTFEVPLRVVEDPQRVLLTELPGTVNVKVRGPWTRVNRLQAFNFKTAAVDLRAAEPGQLEVDEASIVMPSGVVLVEVLYPHVDLRFEDVIEGSKRVAPQIEGQPAEGYRVASVTVTPPNWTVRGGRSMVQGVGELRTEPLRITDATESFTRSLVVLDPVGDVELVTAQAQPRVTVRVEVEPEMEMRELSVPIPVPDGLDPMGVIPESVTVQVSGPRLAFQALDGLELRYPVDASVVPRTAKTANGEPVVELRFGWSEGVPAEVSEALSIDHGVEVVVLPPPPEPPADPPV
ncbi:MAG: YbbR-like domain-containing protein [Nannocystaceae bacterium]|nr:CdaR family protein [bacterium]